ncbi:hypothetical protein Asppvi_004930 [Aspergillus pseudoviridinutans]|uniref:Uncharacterized protein n=1 Tax=Aspergillus pseudoviridinutans TaxID=1517512 RepID=A0A9P3B7C2_9EURO|nr:uncharacterized protein Asppvi_004930 [Aspergillus pseudoviridinutans]GIJ86057.1 hypothetical protein Asppvi_004930 [Aspergillus pseudoviridinutans]
MNTLLMWKYAIHLLQSEWPALQKPPRKQHEPVGPIPPNNPHDNIIVIRVKLLPIHPIIPLIAPPLGPRVEVHMGTRGHNILRVRSQVTTARLDVPRVIITQPDSSVVGAADARTHARAGTDAARAAESVDSLHDGHSRALSAFVTRDVADDAGLGVLSSLAINGRGNRMTDLVSFLDIASTEAAVVLAEPDDELGVDVEDLSHDFLEVVSLQP